MILRPMRERQRGFILNPSCSSRSTVLFTPGAGSVTLASEAPALNNLPPFTWDNVVLALNGETQQDVSQYEWHFTTTGLNATGSQFYTGSNSLTGTVGNSNHSLPIASPWLSLQDSLATLAFRVRLTTLTTGSLVNQRNSSSGVGWDVFATSAGALGIQTTATNITSSNGVLSTGSWLHILVAKNGTSLYLFVNGASVASGTLTISNNTAAEGLKLWGPAAVITADGYLDDLVLSVGECLTTSNFSVPSTAMVGSHPGGYSTWNSGDADTYITVSAGGRNAYMNSSVAGRSGALRGTQGRATGSGTDRYFEVGVDGGNSSNPTPADVIDLVGIGKSTASLTIFPGGDANGYAIYLADGHKYNNFSDGGAYGTGGVKVVGVWLKSNGDLLFKTSGSDPGTAAYTGLSGTFYPMWGPGSGAGQRSGALNTGATAFKWGLPSGAVAWG